jgi:hypothetical protein
MPLPAMQRIVGETSIPYSNGDILYERDEIALRNNRRTDDDPQLVFVVPFRLIEGGIDPFDGYSTAVLTS